MTILGIDLGTTNSACAVWRDGEITMIPNRLGDLLTPSVVHISGKDISVGKIANEKRITEPFNTGSLFKRHIGSGHRLRLDLKQYTATELSGFILRSLKEDAENYLQEKIEEAVVSVPAYFNAVQRKATIQAAAMTGLRVERLINEPTAAAIAYGVHEKPEHTQFIVLDLGGGTFDVSIMEYFDGVLEVHATAGDNFLGGEDFLDLLVDYYLQKSNIKKENLERPELNILSTHMEQVKRQFNTSSIVDVPPLLEQNSQSIILNYQEFEEISQPLLRRLQRPIETSLRDSDIPISDLDELLLVGGATRMKSVRSAVTKLFRRMPSSNLDPDLVVAMGAAIQAGLKMRDSALSDVVLTDVCPYTLGTSVLNPNSKNRNLGDLFSPIIERNTIVPVSRSRQYWTAVDNQKHIYIDILQGESRLSKDNISLGHLTIKVPKNLAGKEVVDVRFSYDINGLLDVDIKALSTDETISKTIVNSPDELSKKEIEISQKKLSALKFHPRDTEVNREVIARGESLYQLCLGDEREEIARLLSGFDVALDTQNEAIIAEARDVFSQELKRFTRTIF